MRQNAKATNRFKSVWSATAGYFERRRQFANTLAELSNLSERELNDIGLHRSMIPSIARKSAGYIG